MVQRHPLVNKMLTWKHLFHVARAAKPTQTIHTATVWRFLARCLFSFFFLFFSALTSFSLSPPHPQPQMMHSPVSHSLIVTSVNELEEGSDAKRLLERHLASILYSTSLSFVCVCVLVCVFWCLLVHACARTLVHSHNSLLRLLEDAVWEREVLSRGCPSIPHLPLRRALCFCTAHVTAIVPN